MNYFFTSDTHFGHAPIIKYNERPFSSVEEMDESLIDIWNSIVGKRDIVYHMGDFAWNRYGHYRMRLNGKIYLCLGNHDPRSKLENLFTDVRDIFYLKSFRPKIFLSHYAHRSWRGSRTIEDGSIHLYGHSHGKLPPYNLSFDVGVDCWNYKPLSYEEVMDNIEKLRSNVQLDYWDKYFLNNN